MVSGLSGAWAYIGGGFRIIRGMGVYRRCIRDYQGHGRIQEVVSGLSGAWAYIGDGFGIIRSMGVYRRWFRDYQGHGRI